MLMPPTRLLVIPGLHDSPPCHWQSWLQARHEGAVRVVQHDWADADLVRWSARIGSTLARQGPARWLAVAHSFGALALVQHLATAVGSPVARLADQPSRCRVSGLAAAGPSWRDAPKPASKVHSGPRSWRRLIEAVTSRAPARGS